MPGSHIRCTFACRQPLPQSVTLNFSMASPPISAQIIRLWRVIARIRSSYTSTGRWSFLVSSSLVCYSSRHLSTWPTTRIAYSLWQSSYYILECSGSTKSSKWFIKRILSRLTHRRTTRTRSLILTKHMIIAWMARLTTMCTPSRLTTPWSSSCSRHSFGSLLLW